MKNQLIEITKDFITMLQTRKSSDELLNFYHTDIEQVEFPNALTKNITVRKLDDLLLASERGMKVLEKEEYEIINTYSFENTTIVEMKFIGTLAIPIGNIPKGGKMIAHFAQFFEYKDGKIIKQRNYDCFEPFI